MVGLLRASAYRPIGAVGGRRVAATDEDAFTLIATALERVMDGTEPNGAPIGVTLMGPVPPGIEAALPLLLGWPISYRGAADGPLALTRALGQAGTETPSLRLVLAADLVRSARDQRKDASGDDGAVAFLFGPSSSEEGASPIFSGLEEEPTAFSAALRLYRERAARSLPGAWVGDWEPGTPRAFDHRVDEYPDSVLRAVSEGAYVPRPRYLENLASRWRLVADDCGACGALGFPARGRCRRCGNTESLRRRLLPRDGARVVATTVIGRGGQPTEFDPQVEAEGPYAVVLAELLPGVRGTLQVTDARPGEVRIGDLVDTRLRRLYPMEGEWRYGRKAVPRADRTPDAD